MKYMKKQRNTLKHNTIGFTVIELMIATAVFALILLLATFAILQIGKTYFKGIAQTQTQNAARTIIDDVSQAIQFSGGDVIAPSGGPPIWWFCIGDRRYSYIEDRQLTDDTPAANQSAQVFTWDNNVANCGTAINWGAPGFTEMLSPGMRIANFEICTPDAGSCPTPMPANSNLYRITVRVVYGDDDLLCSPSAGDCNDTAMSGNLGAADLSCKSLAGSQFCAESELTTVVQKRI